MEKEENYTVLIDDETIGVTAQMTFHLIEVPLHRDNANDLVFTVPHRKARVKTSLQ